MMPVECFECARLGLVFSLRSLAYFAAGVGASVLGYLVVASWTRGAGHAGDAQ